MILSNGFLSVFTFVFLNIIVGVKSQQSQYLRWVILANNINDDAVIQVPPKTDLESFQFFLNITISSNSSEEQCVPSDARNRESRHKQDCFNVTCRHPPRETLGDGCGNHSYSLPVNSYNDSFTWTSKTAEVSWHEVGLDVSVEKVYEDNSSKVHKPTITTHFRQDLPNPAQPQFKHYGIFRGYSSDSVKFVVLQVSGNATWVYYYMTLEAFRQDIAIDEEPPYKILISQKNTTANVMVYDVVATTGEMFKMWTGKSIPERLVRPDCECPRPYMDTYSLIMKAQEKDPVPENQCYGWNISSIPRYTGQYQGKWAIFTEDGWVSDFTDEVKIELSLPQTMLTYAATGRFMWKDNVQEPTAIHRPERMELSIESSTSDHNYTVYISSDCDSDYNMTTSTKPIQMLCSSVNNTSIEDKAQHKCFQWSDLQYLGSTVNGYKYFNWDIPVLVPIDEQLKLDDAFNGERVKIKLIGHYSNSTEGPQDWYHVGGLSLFTRPHCGGKPYQLKQHQPMETLYHYTSFYSDDAKAYECKCPDSMIDDECGNCSITDQPYRYMTAGGRCADCDCTYLGNATYCNHSTGQCPCRSSSNGQEVSIDNRRCEWTVNDDIAPLYGPIAGGTVITVSGDYISEPDVNLSVTLDGQLAAVKNRNNESQSIEIQTGVRNETGYTTLTFHSTTTKNVGEKYRDFNFEYKPNPVLENITPLKSILIGGICLTVTGQNMDSVEAPKLILYSSSVVEQDMDCKVVNNSTLSCQTPILTKDENTHNAQQGELKEPLSFFTLGMRFDGHTKYEYLANNTELRGMSTLSIYDDPIIYTFNDSIGNSTWEYPGGNEIIEVKGKRLNWGVESGDYTIDIGGQGNCTVVNLTSDTLSCIPSSEDPMSVNDAHSLEVSVGNIEKQIGYIYYMEPPSESTSPNDGPNKLGAEAIGLIAMGVGLLFILLGATLFLVRRRQRELNVEEVTELEEILRLFDGKQLSPLIQSRIERCKIPKERLNTGQQIGEGNFGSVYKGQLMTPSGCIKSVAIKSLKGDRDMSFDDFENFLSEGTLMIDFRHENVMSLLGVVFEVGEKPLVVLPYMEKGDLRSFVQQDDLNLLLGDVLQFAYQISNGMAYMVEKQFVHRDLAARNCMVNDANIVKVADFGMSRDINEKDYYRLESMNKPLPIRWMAIESMRHGTFTAKTDVWSFGITMWELFVRGVTPYNGLRNREVMDQTFAGMRLARPETCPPVVYDMMISCWIEDPAYRPNFVMIGNFLRALLSGETVPQADSGGDAGFYYGRNVTLEVPDDYHIAAAENEDDDYILPF